MLSGTVNTSNSNVDAAAVELNNDSKVPLQYNARDDLDRTHYLQAQPKVSVHSVVSAFHTADISIESADTTRNTEVADDTVNVIDITFLQPKTKNKSKVYS